MKIKINNILLTGAATLLFMTGNVYAETFYVKSGGSDGANCKTAATACATPWGAYSKAVAGDEILIAQGAYTYASGVCHYGIDKAVSFVGGYNQDFSSKSDDASLTTIKSNSGSEFCRFYLLGSGHESWLVYDTLTFDLAVNKGHAGAFLTHESINAGAGAWLHLNNVIAKDFNMTQGGLVGLTIHGDKLKITNSHIENFHVDTTGGVVAVDGANDVEISFENSRFINNSSDSHGGVLYISGNNSSVDIKGSVFKGNTTKITNPADLNTSSGNGGVIFVDGNKKIALNIEDSHFQDNLARGGPAVHLAGGRGSTTSKVNIYRSSFVGNQSWQHGSAIYAERGIFDINNSTFSDNIAHSGGSGGPISFNGAKGKLSYSTVYNNQSGTAALGVWYDNATQIELMANLIIGNTKVGSNTPADIWHYSGAGITDKGYNIIGSNNQHGIVDNNGNPHSVAFNTLFNHKNDQNEFTSAQLDTAASEVLQPTAYNGGLNEVWSNMPVKGALDKTIPVAGGDHLFYGLGLSSSFPFASLKQAQGMLSQGVYKKAKYYFDLGGQYDEELNFTAGTNSDLRFQAVVDEKGYLLIASSNPNSHNAYQQVDDLDEASDKILKSVILANLDFDEVRISAPRNGDRGRFDGYNRSQEAINAVKSFKTLPNAGEPGGDQWVVTLSTSGNNYFTGNARGAGTGDGQKDAPLDKEIYYASGQVGIHWIPSRPNEALDWPGGNPGNFFDRLDLWVKVSENQECGVSVTVDGRGMRRPGRLPGDAIADHCNVGAFEINDYYQLDCWDDDGFRPENSVSIDGVNVSASWCFDPTNPNITPQEVFENLGLEVGKLHWMWSLLLATVVLLRRKGVVA